MTDDLDKALKDYESVFDRPAPVRYEVLHFNDEHRRLDALMRRHYNSFHPLVRDIFTSFSLEFSVLLDRVETLENETQQIQDELEEKREKLDKDLDDRVQELKVENQQLKEQMTKYQNRIDELENDLNQKDKIINEKDATIVTQRRQLDLYIEKDTKIDAEKKVQAEVIHESIANVNEFTNELSNIEKQFQQLEKDNLELEQENESLKTELKTSEERYTDEINEINELYQNLKNEFESIINTVTTLENERKTLKAQLVNQSSSQNVDEIHLENENLKQKISSLKSDLLEKENEIEMVRSKNQHFKKIADKILSMKDQLENEAKAKIAKERSNPVEEQVEKKVIHPSDQVKKTKRWARKKTALEQEIEHDPQIKSETEISKDPSRFKDSMRVVDKEIYLDDSVTKIQAKLNAMDKDENELVRSIRESSQDPEGQSQVPISEKAKTSTLSNSHDESYNLSETLEKELEKSGISLDDLDDDKIKSIAKLSNFEKVLSKLENNDFDSIGKFVKDFPKPPESQENTKSKKKIRKPKEKIGS